MPLIVVGRIRLMEGPEDNSRKLPRPKSKQIRKARRQRQKMPTPELLLWQRLRPKVNKEFNFRRQSPLLGRFIVDFYVSNGGRRIVFEIDEQIHVIHEKSDAARDELLRAAGIDVVRISARQVFKDPDGVAEFIRMICRGEIDVKDIE